MKSDAKIVILIERREEGIKSFFDVNKFYGFYLKTILLFVI